MSTVTIKSQLTRQQQRSVKCASVRHKPRALMQAHAAGTHSEKRTFGAHFAGLAKQGIAAAAAAAAAVVVSTQPAAAISLPDQGVKLLCDASCEVELSSVKAVTTPSGLAYKDVIVGEGATPIPGDQVTVNVVGSIDLKDGQGKRVFENSLDRRETLDVRVGTEEPLLIPGLDEGIMGMRMGGIRRLAIPGPLAYAKGLPSAPGRPRIPPDTPVEFDVQLVYIPGSIDGPLDNNTDDEFAELEKLL